MITGVKLEDEPYAGFVDDIADLLDNTDMTEVLKHFGRKTRGEDPIIHFYETFLAAYDRKLRKIRGVYYTPEPVISYIIRSVDYILKEKFGLKDGLADTSKIRYEVKNEKGETVSEECHKVLILDPAAGTGSFLYHVVDLIRSRFMEKGNAGMWSGYVRAHLLPRLFGFELLMAPYAVAHLKLGMQLAGLDLETEKLRKDWAYDFKGDERLKVYLTNTLEQADKHIQRELLGPMRILSQEANAANEVKKDLPIMVIIGNPPYSGHSANDGDWIKKLVQHEYYPQDNMKEKNPKWLLDDYVKFIRWGQWRIEQTGSGILAFITNHSYIDNPTFRQMRKSLMETFDEIYIHDLHGNVKKKETSPDGSKDENVFDIQQGVAICILVKQADL
ncbi:MAG: N-6 DNA methylase, partial [Candidatus Dadabacteria bacterium]|nr:N-6 DNA methylase [Candidatus Dadabacteria bacterium]